MIALTHLNDQSTSPELRQTQSKFFLETIKEFNEENLPIIICGGLNDSPKSLMYKEFLNYGSLESAYTKYNSSTGVEPYTTVKKVEDKIFQECHDYIWYSSDSLFVSHLLEIPNAETFEFNIPCLIYPSDHLSLTCEICFKKPKNLISLSEEYENSKKKFKGEIEELTEKCFDYKVEIKELNSKTEKYHNLLLSKDAQIKKLNDEISIDFAESSRLFREKDASTDKAGEFSHFSLSEKYSRGILSSFKSPDLIKCLKKLKKEEFRPFQSSFIKSIFKSVDDYIEESITKLSSNFLFTVSKEDSEKQFLELWVKDKKSFEKIGDILKKLSTEEEYKGLIELKMIPKLISSLLELSVKMRLAKPIGQFSFFNENEEFNEENHEPISIEFQKSGFIKRTIFPGYIVVDGNTNEVVVYKKSIVETEFENKSDSDESNSE
jgi:hypothetical protein